MAVLAPALLNELVTSSTQMSDALRWCRPTDHPADAGLGLALAEHRTTVLLTQNQAPVGTTDQ